MTQTIEQTGSKRQRRERVKGEPKTSMLLFKVTPAEKESLELFCQDSGVTQSWVLRRLLISMLAEKRAVEIV